jgi:hypothetical protein
VAVAVGSGVKVGAGIGVFVGVGRGVEVGWRMAASVPTGHPEKTARASRQVNVMAQARRARASFPVFQPRW